MKLTLTLSSIRLTWEQGERILVPDDVVRNLTGNYTSATVPVRDHQGIECTIGNAQLQVEADGPVPASIADVLGWTTKHTTAN